MSEDEDAQENEQRLGLIEHLQIKAARAARRGKFAGARFLHSEALRVMAQLPAGRDQERVLAELEADQAALEREYEAHRAARPRD